ncbi:MAG: lamin tail domain-containing protein [Flavobacteriales bacterium]|nr:lamin tail domain-containing protein [Flavobacteriales bacterium]
MNGSPVGGNSDTYAVSALQLGDVVTCTLTSDADCADPNDAQSNEITVDCGQALGVLIFSEYVEGSANNKALELFNPTANDVDLADYSVALYANGSATPTQSLQLTGILPSGQVYVIANSSASAAVLAVADITSAVCSFNGDDAIALLYQDLPTDIIGEIGIDPGGQWGIPTGGGTADNTLRRIPTVTAPESDWSIAEFQWNDFDQDDFTDLGDGITTGFTEHGNEKSLLLPNPTRDGFRINWAAPVHVRVIAPSGALVMEMGRVAPGAFISTDHLDSGVHRRDQRWGRAAAPAFGGGVKRRSDLELRLVCAPSLRDHFAEATVSQNFKTYEGKPLTVPTEAAGPKPVYLEWHREVVLGKQEQQAGDVPRHTPTSCCHHLRAMRSSYTFTVLIGCLLSVAAQAQPCDCPSTFNWMVSTFEENDAGFRVVIDRKGEEAYKEHTDAFRKQVAGITDLQACTDLLNAWLQWFRHGHIGIEPTEKAKSAQPATTAQVKEQAPIPTGRVVKVNEAELMKQWSKVNGLGPIEGIWSMGAYRAAFVKDGTKPGAYAVVILSSKNPNWKPGEVKAEIAATDDGHKGTYYLGDHSPEPVQAKILPGSGSVMEMNGLWVREYPVTELSAEEQLLLRYRNADTPFLSASVTIRSTCASSFAFPQKGVHRQRAHRQRCGIRKRKTSSSTSGTAPAAAMRATRVDPYLYTGPMRSVGVKLWSTGIERGRLRGLCGHVRS